MSSINKRTIPGVSGNSNWNASGAVNHHMLHHQISMNHHNHHQLSTGFINMPRLPPNYLCTICRKPGHAKSFCPEAGTITHTNFIKTPKGIFSITLYL